MALNQFEARFLDRLKSKQIEYATETLRVPKNRTEFGFGEASGVYQGLLLAEQLFEEVIGEDRDRTKSS